MFLNACFLHDQKDLTTLFFLVDGVLGLYKYLDLSFYETVYVEVYHAEQNVKKYFN